MSGTPPPWPVDRPLRLATRGSPLALAQTALVADLLRAAAPALMVEPLVVHTQGDQLADVPLDRIGGQGIFVKEVQAAVLTGSADVTVHSAKDLPSETPAGLVLAAVPERGDPRDVLVGGRLADLVPGATVATGSARRRAQLAHVRPDLTFVELRGNMATRLARAGDGSVHAVVAAKVALDRLGWSGPAVEILSPTVVLPQVGQGALALECAVGDDAVRALLSSIDDLSSHRALDAERSLLAALGGSCSTPVGAWAEPATDAQGGQLGGNLDGQRDGSLLLHAFTATYDGRVLIRTQLSGNDPVELGAAVAERLLGACGGSVVDSAIGWRDRVIPLRGPA